MAGRRGDGSLWAMGTNEEPVDLSPEDPQAILTDKSGVFTLHDHKGKKILDITVSGMTMANAKKYFDRLFDLPMQLDVYTPGEVALLLKVSATRVRQLVNEGKLPAKRYGRGHIRISRAALKAYMKADGLASARRKKQK